MLTAKVVAPVTMVGRFEPAADVAVDQSATEMKSILIPCSTENGAHALAAALNTYAMRIERQLEVPRTEMVKDGSSNLYICPDDGKIHSTENLYAAKLTWSNRCAHWEKFGHGSASIQLMGNTVGRWLSINSAEHGERSSKQTMITLAEAQVRRLRDLCNIVLGE